MAAAFSGYCAAAFFAPGASNAPAAAAESFFSSAQSSRQFSQASRQFMAAA